MHFFKMKVGKSIKKDYFNKKGLGHVEMILSFVIFITALLFLISIFNPFETRDDIQEDYLDRLEKEFSRKMSGEVSFRALFLDEEEECFRIQGYGDGGGENIIIKNEDMELVEGKIQGQHLVVGANESDFFYIFSSNLFEENDEINCQTPPQPNDLDSDKYNMGMWRKYTVYENESLYDLKEEYYDDYEDLKSELRIPRDREFSFLLRNIEDGKVIIEANKWGAQREVYTKNKNIRIIYKDGEIEYKELGLTVF